MRYRLSHLLYRLISIPLLFIWRLTGWRVEMPVPQIDKFVALAAPHTSMWDYYHFLMIAMSGHRRPNVTMKKEMFKGPGVLLHLMGAIPVDRSSKQNFVDNMATRIKKVRRMIMVFTPEGSRSKGTHWRTGFYYTALKAGVPVVLGYIDYRRKRIGTSQPIYLTGDLTRDFERIAAFYREHGYPKYPDKWTPLQLADERQPIELSETA